MPKGNPGVKKEWKIPTGKQQKLKDIIAREYSKLDKSKRIFWI